VVGWELFLDLLHCHHAVLDAVLRELGTMVRRTTDQVTGLVFLDLQSRVARQLLTLAGEATRTDPINQSELINMVGGTRQTVNQALRSLERLGRIRSCGRAFEILDRERLETLAGRSPDRDDRRAPDRLR
jgi:CRP-like cAMP-binding protein